MEYARVYCSPAHLPTINNARSILMLPLLKLAIVAQISHYRIQQVFQKLNKTTVDF